jgi:tetratricopeptide (TPR) repeat protein
MRALLIAAAFCAACAGCAAQDPQPQSQDRAPQAPATQDPLLRQRAAAAENLGRFAEAADLYGKLMQQDPQRAEWAIAAGRCLGRSGRFNDAIDLLTSKRSAFPGVTDVTAMLARTWLLKAEGDPGALHPELCYTDAVKLAEEVLAADPDHEDARLILAQAKYGQGDFAGAVAAAQEAVRRHPQRPGAHVLAGRIAFDLFKQQKRDLEQRQQPPDDEEHARLVAAIDEQRKHAKAEFLCAAELDPARTFARIALAELAVWDKETDQALLHWGEALAVDPQARADHAWIEQHVPWEARRLFYEQTMQRYHARPDAEPKLEANLQWYVARAAYDGGKWQDARAGFVRVLDLNPGFTNALYWAALTAWRLEDRDAAEDFAARYARVSATAFADVLRALPPAARSEIAQMVQFLADRAYRETSHNDNSRDLNHVIAALKDSADAWNNYAFLCRESGRAEEAITAYEHALEKEPDSPQLLNDLGVVLQYHLSTAANLARARKLYERAIDLADRVLADGSSTQVARTRAAQARSDALQNLEKLP